MGHSGVFGNRKFAFLLWMVEQFDKKCDDSNSRPLKSESKLVTASTRRKACGHVVGVLLVIMATIVW